MLQRMSAVLFVSVLAAVPAAAQAPAIEHQPVACVVAGRFPHLTASFTPADAVARARVHFQSEGGRHWYGVAMKVEGPAFAGVLPKPKKSLKSYRYYIEVTDTALGTSRTAEYTTLVGASAAACTDMKTAVGLGSAAVRLEVPAGAPSVPGGFSASGVIAAGAAGAAVAAGATTAAAAGGGISTAVLVGGGLAVAAAGAGVAVAAGGGDEEDGDSRTIYTGTFSGQYVVTQVSVGVAPGQIPRTCRYTHAFTGTMTVIFEPSSPTGQAQLSPTDTVIEVAAGCEGLGPGNFMGFFCALTGAPGSLACNDEITSSSGSRTSTVTHAFSGALSGNVLMGTVAFAFTGQGGNPQTIVTDSASVTFPVTLR